GLPGRRRPHFRPSVQKVRTPRLARRQPGQRGLAPLGSLWARPGPVISGEAPRARASARAPEADRSGRGRAEGCFHSSRSGQGLLPLGLVAFFATIAVVVALFLVAAVRLLTPVHRLARGVAR